MYLQFQSNYIGCYPLINFSCNHDAQSRSNIGSDGTLAWAPVWMGLERGPQFIFWVPYLFKY